MSNVIQQIDFVERVVVTSRDEVLPIVHLFDSRGHETRERAEAVIGIAGQVGRWITFQLGDYCKTALQ